MDGGRDDLREVTYTVLFPFCGIGGGALGFKWAEAAFRSLGIRARFKILGGIEADASTARDFTRLTGAPCMVCKVEDLTPEKLRAFFGDACPDVVFFSPPCKPASGLLAAAIAMLEHYRFMAMLGAVWIDLMFATWPMGPRLLIMENVPRIKTRAPEMMERVRAACRKHRYLIHEGTHNLGEVGGLAQNRDRLLFLARRKDVSSLLYQPTKRRVRSVGEVLGALPLPGDPAAGPLHALPNIEAITALRLALIPAGGDWHDLPSKVHLHPSFAALLGGKHGKKVKPSERTPFNDVWKVVRWADTASCVSGGGTPSSGGLSVADPRFNLGEHAQSNLCTVGAWGSPSRTVTGASRPAGGALSVADPRAGYRHEARGDDHGVIGWGEAAGTITGRTTPSTGRFCVADPRPAAEGRYGNNWRVEEWGEAAHTVTGQDDIQVGAPSVADPRTGEPSHPHTYGVLPWDGASHTITASTFVGCGPFSVADPRVTCKTRENSGIYGVLPWDGPSGTIVGHACHDNGRFSVADPRTIVRPPFPLILSEDGTWHRPLTTLECAVLQGFPDRWEEGPFTLEGTKDARRVKIGDAVPPLAAMRIAEQMLHTLVYADAGIFALSSGGAVWVREREAARFAGRA